MIKILYVIPRLAKAGTEKHLLSLAYGLDRAKFEVTICCLFVDTNYHELHTNSHKFEIKLICLHRKTIYDLRIIFDLFQLIRKERFAIVHTYLFGFHYLAGIPAKLAKVPVVISSRRQLATWKKRHHIILEKLGNRFSDKVIACSNAVRDFAIRQENLENRY